MDDITHETTELEAAEPETVGTFPVRLLTGYVPLAGGEKLAKGSEVDLPADEAKAIINAGLAVRNDPL